MRLFAAARDAAGTGELVAEERTVGELLAGLEARLGPEFAAVLGTCRVWVNGDEPEHGDRTELRSGDEVAVLPPVSGG